MGTRTKMRFSATDQSRGGFTLLEMILALALLATVLTVSYRILTNILDTERLVSRKAAPEKIGQGILSLLRSDLLGVVYKNLGPHVFQVIDNGEGEEAQDQIQFFTTVQPLASEAVSDEFGELSGINAVSWYMEETEGAYRANRVFTLYRNENLNYQPLSPFQLGGGTSYEVYDKMRGISIEVFDGYDWWTEWDSMTRLSLEAEEALALEEASVTTVSDSSAATGGNRAAATVDELSENALLDTLEQVKPPAAIPVAVRIEITFIAGDEKGAYLKEGGSQDFETYTYVTVVPLLTSMRIPLNLEEGSSTGTVSGLLDDEGAAGGRGDGPSEGGGRRGGGPPGGGSGGAPPGPTGG